MELFMELRKLINVSYSTWVQDYITRTSLSITKNNITLTRRIFHNNHHHHYYNAIKIRAFQKFMHGIMSQFQSKCIWNFKHSLCTVFFQRKCLCFSLNSNHIYNILYALTSCTKYFKDFFLKLVFQPVEVFIIFFIIWSLFWAWFQCEFFRWSYFNNKFKFH